MYCWENELIKAAYGFQKLHGEVIDSVLKNDNGLIIVCRSGNVVALHGVTGVTISTLDKMLTE